MGEKIHADMKKHTMKKNNDMNLQMYTINIMLKKQKASYSNMTHSANEVKESKNGLFMRDQFPGIPEAFSRETGRPKIRDFPGIPVPGIPGSKP